MTRTAGGTIRRNPKEPLLFVASFGISMCLNLSSKIIIVAIMIMYLIWGIIFLKYPKEGQVSNKQKNIMSMANLICLGPSLASIFFVTYTPLKMVHLFAVMMIMIVMATFNNFASED